MSFTRSIVVSGFPYRPGTCPARVWRVPGLLGCALCGTQVLTNEYLDPQKIECRAVRERYIQESAHVQAS